MEDILAEAGLSKTQSKLYLLLIRHGAQTPPQVARLAKLTRTNAYKVLDSLVELGLASKQDRNKKLMYQAANPTVLEDLVHTRRTEIMKREASLKANMPTLLTYFFSHNNQPGIRYYQGKAGIVEIFDDIIRTGKTVYFIRPAREDTTFMGDDFFKKLIKRKNERHITTIALTPHSPDANYNAAIDRINRMERTWLPSDAYHASVEWQIYGDKTAILSYKDEGIGMIIESPQIAESMRQIFTLLQRAYAPKPHA